MGDNSTPVQVTVNGEHMATLAVTLAGLVDSLGLERKQLVAEQNGKIIAPEAFDEQPVASGDVIELVRFVGGG